MSKKVGFIDNIGTWIVVTKVGRIYTISNFHQLSNEDINKEVRFISNGSSCTIEGFRDNVNTS